MNNVLEKTGDAMEQAGDALTKGVTNASRKAAEAGRRKSELTDEQKAALTAKRNEETEAILFSNTDDSEHSTASEGRPTSPATQAKIRYEAAQLLNRATKSDRKGSSNSTRIQLGGDPEEQDDEDKKGIFSGSFTVKQPQEMLKNLQTGLSIPKAPDLGWSMGSKKSNEPKPTIVALPKEEGEDEASSPTSAARRKIQVQQQEVLKKMQLGWSSVTESVKKATEAVEENSVKFSRQLAKQTEQFKKEAVTAAHNIGVPQELMQGVRGVYYKRDPALPLDVKALKDAEVVYITSRLITMSHPAKPSEVDPDITGERKLAAVGHLLERRHAGRYMVWNLSEVEYDASIFDDQVLTYSFPGSPSPPLGLLLKLLVSMESWLKADQRNVAVVHCLTGKGRTSTVLAAFLCWMGQAGFGNDVFAALQYIATCKQLEDAVDDLTIPSQRRYCSYFKNMLDGVRPSQPPLMLKRVIMSTAPRYARGPPRLAANNDKTKDVKDDSNKNGGSENAKDNADLMGCMPYLQVFKAGSEC